MDGPRPNWFVPQPFRGRRAPGEIGHDDPGERRVFICIGLTFRGQDLSRLIVVQLDYGYLEK